MKKILGCTTLAALLFSSSPLMALSNEEIEARFQQYEARIKALESDLANKPAPVYEQNLGKAMDAKPVNMQSISDSKLKINGFITAAATVADEDVNNFNTSDVVNFRGLSKAGVQLTYQLNDKADATVQMVARSDDTNGTDTWELNAEWAYLGYQLTDDLKVRAGRMRVPFYMYSESLDVGYSYPWARPPLSVYRSPITAYDGVDMTYLFNTGGLRHTLQFWTGSYADTSNGPAGIPDDIELKDQYGVNLTSTWGDFTARAMMFTIAIDGTTTVDFGGGAPPIYVQLDAEDKLDYSSLGFQWDNGQYFVITETTDLRSEKGLFFTDEKAGYVTVGTRIQDWTPYATYGWYHTANEGDFVGIADGEPACGGPAAIGGDTTNKSCSSQSKNISLGLRKELGTNLSFTMQWDHYSDFGDTNGFWGFADYSATGFPVVTVNPGEGWDNADVYTMSLDAVF
jgi:hypothetical protein